MAETKYKVFLNDWNKTIGMINTLVDASAIITNETISQSIMGEIITFLKAMKVEDLKSISGFLHQLERSDSKNTLFNEGTLATVDLVISWIN